MSALDRVAAFVKVVASALSRDDTEPTFNVTAVGGFRLDGSGDATGEDDSDEGGEQAAGQVAYGSLGVIGRPLPPEGDRYAEAVALRVDGGLSPIGWRDMRINRAVNPGGNGGTPAEGQIMLAGYGGAFLSLANKDDGDDVLTLYVPHDRNGDGIPQKAHAISIDPAGGITLVHAEGARIDLTEDGIAWAVDDATFGSMRAGEVSVNAAKILLKGNCYLGAQAELALNALYTGGTPPGPGLPPPPVPPLTSPSVFLSVV